jgi:hypothetical protein
MALETIEVVLEDDVWSAVQSYCERRQITPDQLVSDHLRSLIATSPTDEAAG